MFVTLMYHVVDRRIWSEIAVSEEAFEAQLAHLRREGYPLLTLPEVVEIASGAAAEPERGVFLTFDDGYADNLHAALPRLRHFGAEATMFVPTEYVGGCDSWNAGPEDSLRYLDWHELEDWLAGGGRIGGHTHGHETPADVGRDELRMSIVRNRRLLEERLGVDPVAFAYPNGAVSRAARAEVACHYEVAWTVTGGTWKPERDRYRLNRYGIGRHVGIDEFAYELEDLFESLESGRARVRRRLRGNKPLPRPAGPRVALVVGRDQNDPFYPARLRFADLLAAGWDVHLLHDGHVLHHGGLDDLPDDVLRQRVHPPPPRLQRLLPRAGLLAGLARAVLRRPLPALAGLAGSTDRYLRAVLLGLRPDVVHLRSGAAPSWLRFLPAVGGRILIEGAEETPTEVQVRGRAPRRARVVRATAVPGAVDASLLQWPEPESVEVLHALAIGPLTWTQGYEHLVHAVRVLRERGVACECRIVGSGELHSAIAFARHQLDVEDAVELLRPDARPGLIEHLRWADVLANVPLVPAIPPWLVPAQAAARPLVTTELPDGHDAPGLRVRPGDVDDLADALESLARDAELRRRLARAGREHVVSLPDMTTRFDGFRRLYREVLEGDPRPV